MTPIDLLFCKFAETSIRASLLIVPLLLLRPWLRRMIGSQWLCILWLLLLGRLLVPVTMESRWGLSNRWPGRTPFSVGEQALARVTLLPATKESHPVLVPKGAIAPHVQEQTALPGLAGALWAVGVAIGAAGLGIRLWKTGRLASETSSVTNGRILEVYRSIPAEMRRKVELRATRELDVPTLAGMLRPQIWLPFGWGDLLSNDEIRQVLLHELGHARRHDLLVQWLFAISHCLYWFNPVIWVFARLARFDREMACDAWVLTKADLTDPAQYGATLLKIVRLLSNPLRTAPSGVAMAISKRNLTTRIAGIASFVPRASWRGLVVTGVVLAGLALLTTQRVAVGQPAKLGTSSEAKADTSPPVKALNPPPAKVHSTEVEIEAKFVEFTRSEFTELSAPGEILAGVVPPATDPYPTVQDTGKEVTLLEPSGFQKIMRALNGKQGVDLCSTPRVTTRTGQRALVEIVREFKYATEFQFSKEAGRYEPTAFETKDLGLTMEVTPKVEADGKSVTLNATPQVVNFLGFKPLTDEEKKARREELGEQSAKSYDPENPTEPVFSEHKRNALFRMGSGQTAVFRGMAGAYLDYNNALLAKWTEATNRGERTTFPKDRVIVVFLTARILSASESAASDAAEEIRQAAHAAAHNARKAAEFAALEEAKNAQLATGGVPLGIAVPGKPGFVRSPFAPDSGYIDVRGFTAGSDIKCPYTQKTFRIPPN